MCGWACQLFFFRATDFNLPFLNLLFLSSPDVVVHFSNHLNYQLWVFADKFIEFDGIDFWKAMSDEEKPIKIAMLMDPKFSVFNEDKMQIIPIFAVHQRTREAENRANNYNTQSVNINAIAGWGQCDLRKSDIKFFFKRITNSKKVFFGHFPSGYTHWAKRHVHFFSMLQCKKKSPPRKKTQSFVLLSRTPLHTLLECVLSQYFPSYAAAAAVITFSICVQIFTIFEWLVVCVHKNSIRYCFFSLFSRIGVRSKICTIARAREIT